MPGDSHVERWRVQCAGGLTGKTITIDGLETTKTDVLVRLELADGRKQTLRLAGGRMVPRDKDNPDSYKVRKGKVGGYRDYFTDEEVAAIDARLAETLDPLFGYK